MRVHNVVKEIEDHRQNIKRVQLEKKEEEQRLLSFQKIESDGQLFLKEKKEEVAALKQKVKETEVKLIKQEQELTKLKGNNSQITTTGQETLYNKQLLEREDERQKQEELCFLELGKIEELEKLITEKEKFLSGLQKSLLDIKKEVDEVAARLQLEIESHEEEINVLIKSLTLSEQEMITNSIKKYPYTKFSSLVLERGVCQECAAPLPRVLNEKAQKQDTLENCESCRRILLFN